jgi:hypothetical protein
MPALKNQKHEVFAQAVALGMPASQAYVECVSINKACSDRTAEVTGSKLTKDSEIALRIAELRKEVGKAADKKFGLTKDIWLERLEKIASAAEGAKDYSAATGALRELGKATSFYDPERITLEVEVKLGGNAESNGDH